MISEEEVKLIKQKTNTQMQTESENFQKQLKSVNPHKFDMRLIEDIEVVLDGVSFSLKRLAYISKDNLEVGIKPFSSDQITRIANTIRNASEYFSNVSILKDDKILLKLPPITVDMLREIVAKYKTIKEKYKQRIRDIRRDAIETFKKSKPDKQRLVSFEKQIQIYHDDSVSSIDNSFANWEKVVGA